MDDTTDEQKGEAGHQKKELCWTTPSRRLYKHSLDANENERGVLLLLSMPVELGNKERIASLKENSLGIRGTCSIRRAEGLPPRPDLSARSGPSPRRTTADKYSRIGLNRTVYRNTKPRNKSKTLYKLRDLIQKHEMMQSVTSSQRKA